MKAKRIAIPTDDKVNIAHHAGRCKYFAIYDVSPDSIIVKRFIENQFTAHCRRKPYDQSDFNNFNKESPIGHHAHDALLTVLSDCQVVISRGMGHGLHEDLSKAGITAHIVADEGSIDEIINKYLKDGVKVDQKGFCGYPG
ncbi:MAG: hypothetical protein A2042_06870 [Candidatus Schekmanbacteria bacterium GWA2_38_11]|uniref:Dinitrogenase iron-molybdenum cofactor biosynthesis domain-containing protein n=1 Tax=Candidatus Schekmanbacteria bacterium GWA2_38_11 TaxID=1817876 RepID=A0A1F7RGP6_9BACT|nr:MAG: hypothetical protein A2042_06870 [Candidatus Schekmanbacteria bacterium GWA2_38_11]